MSYRNKWIDSSFQNLDNEREYRIDNVIAELERQVGVARQALTAKFQEVAAALDGSEVCPWGEFGEVDSAISLHNALVVARAMKDSGFDTVTLDHSKDLATQIVANADTAKLQLSGLSTLRLWQGKAQQKLDSKRL